MRQPRALLAVTVVAFVLGILLVMQLRAQNSAGGLEQLSAADLTVLIANLNDRNGAAARPRSPSSRPTCAALQATRRQRRGQRRPAPVRSDPPAAVGRASTRSQGRGIVVARRRARSRPTRVNDLLDELRLAGAEAIAIEDVRVVAGHDRRRPAGRAWWSKAPAWRPPSRSRPSARRRRCRRSSIARAASSAASRSASRTSSSRSRPSDAPLQLPATRRDLIPDGATPRI